MVSNTCNVFFLFTQGRPQDLAGGGPRIFFLRFGNLHVAKPCALLGGFGGMPPRENFFKMVQFGAFWCIFRSDFVFKKISKITIFYIKFLKIAIFYIKE